MSAVLEASDHKILVVVERITAIFEEEQILPGRAQPNLQPIVNVFFKKELKVYSIFHHKPEFGPLRILLSLLDLKL